MTASRGRGQPPRLDEPFTYTLPDSTNVTTTVAARIIELVRNGDYLETAAGTVGLGRGTIGDWLHEGARTRQKRHTDPDHDRRTETKYQRLCSDFSAGVERAKAEWESEQLLILESLGRGGRKVESTTVKHEVDAEGNERVVERTTRTEYLKPDAAVIEWRLKRMFPDRYAEKITVEDASAIPIPLDTRIDRLLAEVGGLSDADADGDASGDD